MTPSGTAFEAAAKDPIPKRLVCREIDSAGVGGVKSLTVLVVKRLTLEA